MLHHNYEFRACGSCGSKGTKTTKGTKAASGTKPKSGTSKPLRPKGHGWNS